MTPQQFATETKIDDDLLLEHGVPKVCVRHVFYAPPGAVKNTIWNHKLTLKCDGHRT